MIFVLLNINSGVPGSTAAAVRLQRAGGSTPSRIGFGRWGGWVLSARVCVASALCSSDFPTDMLGRLIGDPIYFQQLAMAVFSG